MSELSKNQLTTENNNSFPNNNTGYITPTLLRTFNQNMIDSLVDEQQYNVDSASFNQRINVLDPSGSAAAISALEQATSSLYAYTASQNSFNSSATASIVALQNFSSSLDTTFATDAELSASVSALSASIAVTDLSQSSSIAALQQFSSSLDTTFATDAQLSASASTLQNNITSLSQSIAVTDLAQSQSIAALQQFSSSLDSTFATDTQLSASASTLQNNINTKLDSASFNSYTASQSSNITASLGSYLLTSSFNTYTQSAASGVSASINTATSSLSQSLSASIGELSASVAVTNGTQLSTASFNVYTASTDQSLSQLRNSVSQSATTGSNTFIGNQIVSGNVNIAGNITAVSASFTYVTTIFETASVIFSSGSNQFGDELSDVQTLSGSVRVQGGLTVNGVPVQTSSFDASGYLLTSSFNQYTQSESANITSSISALSSSIAVTTNNLDLEVNGKLDSSSFNTYTQSNDTKVNALIAQTGSYAISSSVANTFDAFSSSISLTYATKTELSASASTLQNGINSKVENSTFNTYTQSQAAVNAGLTTAIGIRLLTSSFNTYTSSNDGKVNSLIAATGSYITSAQTSSMTVLSSSFAQTASFALNVTPTDVTPFLSKSVFDTYTGSAALGVSESINSATQSLSSSIAVTTNNLDLEVNGKLDSSSFNSYTQSNDSVVNALVAATSSYVTEAETGSFITSAQTASMSVLSSSYSVTASFALNVTPTDVSPFLSASTFNSYTQSNDAKVNSLIDKTGSFATTGSNTFNGSQSITGSVSLTGTITATSASFQYVQTIFETASTIYSSGSNQFGDEASDVQTLYGSVNAVNRFTASGLNYPTADNGEFSFIQTDGNGNLSLQYVNTTNDTVYNGEATTLVKGTPVYVSGSQGANPKVFRADAADVNKMPVTYIIGDDIPTAETGRAIILGQIDGINTTGYGEGVEIYAAEGGGFTDSRPSGSTSIVQLLGIVTKEGSGGKGLVLNPGPATLPNLQTGYVWVGNGTNQPVAIATSSIQTDVSGYTTTASFNSYTSSNDSKVNSLIAATSSYAISSSVASITSASQGQINSLINATSSYITSTGSFATTGSNTFIGNQIISGNLLVTGSNINLEVDPPALSVGVTNIKTIADASASGVITSLDITRLGAGPTGDLTAIRLQTFSGSSDVSGDRLLSRITTGVNRNTSTGLAGGVVNNQFNAVWATGSSAFTSQIVETAQSNSANLTLNAGNLASNNAGGTASIAAGLIRIGTNAEHTISTTGSFGPILLVAPLNTPAFRIASGSFEITTPQGSGSFYTNLPITSSGMRLNGLARFSGIEVIGLPGAAGSGSISVENDVTASNLSASQNIYANTVFANVFNGTASFATNALSSSYALTASFALNAGASVDTGSLVTTSSFNSFTASALLTSSGWASTGSNTFIGNQTITGSVILSSSADIELTIIGNTIISGNLVVTGSNINLEVDAPALSVGVTNVKTLLDATASGVVTTEDIYRTGAGPTGDLSGVRLQTLSGSDTTNDTLLSRISTGVNRNTSTGIVGSVVNSIITSTWATGSGGGRVSYSSNVIANAQSASSTLTLNAGNPSSNFAGGTASLAAGRVNIGTTGATITSTGSWTQQGSIVTSGGITVNNLGITATSGSINGDFRVSGSVNISGSNPTQLWTSGGLNLSGSLISNITDIYTGSNNANFIVTLGSASMASLIAAGTTNPNTLYFVI